MKSIAAISNTAFYQPASSMAETWYGQPRTSTRTRVKTFRPVAPEQDSRKQEVVCSVILTLSLLFAFAQCIIQFAHS